MQEIQRVPEFLPRRSLWWEKNPLVLLPKDPKLKKKKFLFKFILVSIYFIIRFGGRN